MASIRVNYVMQVCTAGISFVASLMTTLMIGLSPRKLASPYRRLIFGMSIADIFQSLALLTGPFFIPAGTPYAIFASMNISSCEANGFLMVFGSTTVPLYMFALSLFYLCKLNLKLSNRDFTERIEKKLHFSIISVMTIMCSIMVPLDLYNPIPGGSFCYIEEYPFGCSFMPDSEECIRGGNVKPYNIFFVCIINLCFIGIIVNMTMICMNSFYIERAFRSRAGDPSNYADHSCFRDFLLCVPFRNYHQHEHEADADYVLRLYKRETIIQSCLYVGAFFLAYLLPMMQTLGSFFHYQFPPVIRSLMAFFYPLGGLFNIFVYTRPKIVRFRHAYPDCSRLKALFLVMKAGGEVPDVSDPQVLVLCCNCMQHDNKDEQTDSTNDVNSLNAAQIRMLDSCTA